MADLTSIFADQSENGTENPEDILFLALFKSTILLLAQVAREHDGWVSLSVEIDLRIGRSCINGRLTCIDSEKRSLKVASDMIVAIDDSIGYDRKDSTMTVNISKWGRVVRSGFLVGSTSKIKPEALAGKRL
jgi:hypothetical protein